MYGWMVNGLLIALIHFSFCCFVSYTSLSVGVFFANDGIQEALVNEAFPLLLIKFRTLKRPQSLRL